MESFDVGDTTLSDAMKLRVPTPSVDTESISNNTLFSSLNGLGTLASVIGGFMAHNDEKRYKDALLKREDARIQRQRERQDRFDASMRASWG